MKTVIITRQPSTPEGTFGYVEVSTGLKLNSGELPWHNNIEDISCIPIGTYTVKWLDHLKHGFCYEVQNVPNGRTAVLFHAANWMGDAALGYFTQLEGCIALGTSIGTLTPKGYKPQRALLRSGDAIKAFEAELAKEDFTLHIL